MKEIVIANLVQLSVAIASLIALMLYLEDHLNKLNPK